MLSDSREGLYAAWVTNKRRRVLGLIEPFQGHGKDAPYAAYFDCFNRQLYFEAHEVLEDLWLSSRESPNQAFYKGLIQVAGAFVHLQKGRLRPAAAVFRLAESNLGRYGPIHERLDVESVLRIVREMLRRLEQERYATNPFTAANAPKLELSGKNL